MTSFDRLAQLARAMGATFGGAVVLDQGVWHLVVEGGWLAMPCSCPTLEASLDASEQKLEMT